ncbi:hypothetical protein HYT52_00115 [Candidatus Woesearchaeota archaeon]|nr:hypothetical protein [Candidatus Woesearchaeota archaeon]
MVVLTKIKKRVLEDLPGFIKEEPKTIYEELRLSKNGVTLILYTSGKLLLQRNSSAVKKMAEFLEHKGAGKIAKEEHFRQEKGFCIGSDESLKGDTFGGIVVAAVKADEKIRKKLIELGVADSKTLSDKEILPLAEKIKKAAECEIKSILPEEYNQLAGSVTDLLNRLHFRTASYLSPGRHIVDKYPGCTVGDVQEEKAESKYVEVAAASILARATALQQLDFLSVEAGFPLPKGSTHVLLALQELKERGLNFKKFVKIDFRNVQEFLS